MISKRDVNLEHRTLTWLLLSALPLSIWFSYWLLLYPAMSDPHYQQWFRDCGFGLPFLWEKPMFYRFERWWEVTIDFWLPRQSLELQLLIFGTPLLGYGMLYLTRLLRGRK